MSTLMNLCDTHESRLQPASHTASETLKSVHVRCRQVSIPLPRYTSSTPTTIVPDRKRK